MNNEPSNINEPENSRIFIIYNKNYPISHNEFEKMFGKFGTITNIYIVKNPYREEDDKSTKGIAYIKYSKASEAFNAIEFMNGYRMGASNSPIKVLIASSVGQNQQYSEMEYNRLFILISKTHTELDLAQIFSLYGEITKVHIVRNRYTGQSKGIAFITYKRPSSAALAIEQLVKSQFKPVLAKPKQDKVLPQSNKRKIDSEDSMYNFDLMASLQPHPQRNKSIILTAYTSGSITHNDLFKILNIVPGLELISELSHQQMYNKKTFRVAYRTLAAAEYAVSRINGLEYPPGIPIKLEISNSFQPGPSAINKVVSKNISKDIQVLSNTVTKAIADIKSATKTATLGISNGNSTPLVPNKINERELSPVPVNTFKLFFVCEPIIPPMDKLEDTFKTFEGLINISIIKGMNYGYVTYDSQESATKAINCFNDKKVYNSDMKLMKAEPRDPRCKRIKSDIMLT